MMIILFFFADSQLHIGGKELDHHFPTAHRLDLQLPGQRQYGQQERLRKRLSRAKQEEEQGVDDMHESCSLIYSMASLLGDSHTKKLLGKRQQ